MWLSNARLKEIDNAISNLLLRYEVDFPKDSIGKLLDRMGIKYGFSSKLPSEVSGFIAPKDGETYIIVNEKESLQRRVFSLAHELGHFVLHHPKDKTMFRIDQVDNQLSNEETEANYFAASLLVPEEKLKWALTQSRDISLIARFFGVSESVISNRINWIQKNG